MRHFPSADELRDLLARNDSETIRRALDEFHPRDAAEAFEDLEDDEIWAVLRRVDIADAAAAFGHLALERQARLIEGRNPTEAAQIAGEMAADDRTDLIQALDDSDRELLLAKLSHETRAETERLSTYAEDSVGSVMSTEYAALPIRMTVGEAIDLLRLEAPNKESIYSIYVINEQNELAGQVSLKDLVLANPQENIADMMETEVVSVRADAPRTEAARLVKEYDFLAIPAVDDRNRLVGMVTVDDVLDVEETEATMDFHRMAPVGALKGGMREAAMTTLYRARVPWLLVLVFMNIFSGAGIAYFEDTIEAMVALVFFLPLLIDSGGNAGSQSATLMVRALATGDVRMQDWWRLIRKEVLVALMLGLSMALAVMLIASFRAPEVLVPVGLTMVATVMFGCLIGISLPFIFTKLKMDPATASGPLITSLADIGGVLIYFSIATWWLGDAIREAAEAAAI
ncbi:MAG: magnesium transporter [Phycisphaerales bacterium]|nr:magnesium transporter [Planctomycetota bacterium]MCH8508946.1 magnesium transporter [Phycisphaerales bacterium]